ncbi:MAG: polysaccharide deacetylase family protein [Bacteroidota bacterium]
MRFLFCFILLSLFQNCKNAAEQQMMHQEEEQIISRPTLSFTFDDGITSDILDYKFEVWNDSILSALATHELKATFFVTGSNKLDTKGRYLLQSWNDAGHQIANHTYTHPNFNNEKLTTDDFEQELLRTDSVISTYTNYAPLFRFPYLKEGAAVQQVNGYRAVLSKHNYKNGSVTIDASDWYVNSELIKSIRKNGYENAQVEKYKAYYIEHLLDRAKYYEDLAFQLTNRHIPHTLLLHHNLTSALFLDDLIKTFKSNGWQTIDAPTAFQDSFYNQLPDIVPAGESLVWSLAKASGEYEGVLRYPAEDSRYEIPKMKAFGL